MKHGIAGTVVIRVLWIRNDLVQIQVMLSRSFRKHKFCVHIKVLAAARLLSNFKIFQGNIYVIKDELGHIKV
jgi:hypothetical protein